jgi:hypothetical protein
MSLGSVLLQPQLLKAAQRPLEERAPNALVDLFTRLVSEVANGGPGLHIIEQELVASVEALVAEVEPRLGAARTRLEGLVDPLVSLVEASVAAPSDAGDTFDRIVGKAQSLTDAAGTAMGGLTSARVGELAGTLFEVFETDLGLTEARARAFLSASVDRIVTRLQADYVGGSADAAAYNRYALGSALREVVTMASQDIDLPTLNKTTLLPALVERLQALGMDGKIADAQSATLKVSAAFGSMGALKSMFTGGAPAPVRGPAFLTAMPMGAASGAPVGAAPGLDHCWYASWLKGQNVAHEDCTSNPDLEGVDFGETLSAKTMEDLAHVSGVLSCLAEAGRHFSSMRQGDFLSNLFNAIWHLLEAGMALGGVDSARWVKWLMAIVTSGFGGLERARFNDWFGTLLILSDVAETQLYARWTWLAREAMLSAFTLKNNKRGLVNHSQIEGVAHVFGELGNLFMALILAKARKRDFGFPNPSGGSWGRTIGFVIAAIGVNTFLTLVAGTLVAFAFAGDGANAGRIFRTFFKDRIFGRATGGVLILQTFAALITHILDFYIYYFMFADGETAGGKLTGVGKEAFEFAGYPKREDSPYRLPWAKGQLYQCAQGNHGLWSHTPFSYEIELYAVDFNFDHGDEILAMRDGIVWDYTESKEDGNTEEANEIIILHDPPIPGQDFDENNTPIKTFTVYLHGKKDSISRAFPPNGPTTEKSAPGLGFATKVKRGQVIMFADDTGRSAYNHLHTQVRPMNAAGTGPADYTIPFVFGDDDVASSDGVLKSGVWYDSSNVKVT